MRQSIKEVLMERDGLEEEEALELIQSATVELMSIVENGGTVVEAEDFIREEFGLEPDYLDDLIQWF